MEIEELRNFTGREHEVNIYGRTFRFLNQRSREWSHLYEYEHSGATMSDAGCGIFSLCHAVEYLCGLRIDAEGLADFSCSTGGRCDDGTDRPKLLKGMVEAGLDAKYGFRYDLDGRLNDPEALWACLNEGGAALCNLRRGHIVSLTGARTDKDGERQVLVIDSLGETSDVRVRDAVREVLPGSELRYPVYNAQKLFTGISESYGVFWVTLTAPMDFNLLHKR